MLNSFLWSLVKMDTRLRYGHWTYVFAHIFTLLLSLSIYWFTSKAFSPALDPQLKSLGSDYFTYLIIGEVFLAIPFYFMEAITNEAHRFHLEGIWKTTLGLPLNKAEMLLKVSLKGFPREVLSQTIFLILAANIFNLSWQWSELGKALVLTIIFSLIFLLIGLFFAGIIFMTGRGKGLLGHFNSLNAFFAGSFFPIAVFPKELQSILMYLNPYTFFLENIRKILAGNEVQLQALILSFIIFTILFGLGAYFIWKKANRIVQRDGLPNLIRY